MRSALGALFGLALTACAGRAAAPSQLLPAREYPGHIEPSEALGKPFVVQQNLRGKYGDKKLSLDVVVQYADGKLTLLGLTPFGSRAFVLTQSGTQTHFEKFIDREIPFDPSYVLNDVHRVFFRGLSGPRADGSYTEEHHDERVTERWQGGHVVERRFERVDGEPAGAVEAKFLGAPDPVIAREVQLTNAWFGYSLRVTSPEQRFLD